MSRTRKTQHSEEVRSRILTIAGRILSEEGEDALSIRRITKDMDYSAGIVYHYFKNKEDIVAHVLQEGYRQILTSARPPDASLPPDETIRAGFIRFLYNSMKNAAEYRAIMFSSSPPVLEFMSMLGEGAGEKRQAIQELVQSLEAGISAGLFAPCDTELTAQALWCAVYGLLARLLVEGDIPPRRRARLIECQIDILMRGLRV